MYSVLAKRTKKIIYKDGETTLKIFDNDFSKSDILNEALNLARMEEAGLKVPKLLEVTVIEGKWAIRTEYIEGKTLQTLMQENPEKEEEYLELFVNIQKNIFSFTVPLANKIKDKMKRKIKESGLDDNITYELQTRLDSMPNHKKVCHGDYNPSNIIMMPDGDYRVIDWSHVTQGNASADAARTYLLFCLAGKKDLADKYLNLFCKKNNVTKEYVQRWMPIVAASQLVKGRSEERDFLLHWVNVIDFE